MVKFYSLSYKICPIFLDRRTNILAEKRNNASINGSTQSIDTGKSGDQAVIKLETWIQRSSWAKRASRR